MHRILTQTTYACIIPPVYIHKHGDIAKPLRQTLLQFFLLEQYNVGGLDYHAVVCLRLLAHSYLTIDLFKLIVNTVIH